MVNRTEEIRIRLTPAEKETLLGLHKATGASVSTIVRGLVFTSLDQLSREIIVEGNPDAIPEFMAAIGLVPRVPKLVSEEEAAANEARQK